MVEEIICEVRDQQMDLLARAKFAEPEVPFEETRAVLESELYPDDVSADNFNEMLALDWVEIG